MRFCRTSNRGNRAKEGCSDRCGTPKMSIECHTSPSIDRLYSEITWLPVGRIQLYYLFLNRVSLVSQQFFYPVTEAILAALFPA